ncbi:MAG: hypothetical protein C0407_16210, partial [Desulfobacca sp.]|nr:hypothetical protein [Desulfobacca sp.]
MDRLSDRAQRLILDFEGLDSPPDWPGGSSGITIGIGYDLGFVTPDQFESDWSEPLSPSERQRLRGVIGLKGQQAKALVPGFSDIRIKRVAAEKVFKERTIPLFQVKAEQAFPGIDALPVDAQGALVSLVYNRGASMTDDSPEDRR